MAGRWKVGWKRVAGGALALLLGAYLGLGLWIGHDVREAVARAGGGEDPLAALVAVATAGDRPLAERNRAVWALGQLGDPAALPALEGLQTGRDCDHGREVCQHEVEKAIRSCEGATNITAPLWRHGALASRS